MAQRHAVGNCHTGAQLHDLVDLPDDERLIVLCGEAGLLQPHSQVVGFVIAEPLPLEPPTEAAEEVDLLADHPVCVRLDEVAPDDNAAPLEVGWGHDPQHGATRGELHLPARLGRHGRASHLLVVRTQRELSIHCDHDPCGTSCPSSACWRIQACIAIAAAAPALIERVDPNCAMEQTALAASCAAGDRPGPS